MSDESSDRRSTAGSADAAAATPAASQRRPAGPPPDPALRQVSRRVAAAAMVGGAAGAAGYVFYDGQRPVRTRPQIDRLIPDHRVKLAPTVPRLVIARGPDPAKNVEAVIARMGGMSLFIAKGDVVLIKPNVGWDRKPEQAANTNPAVVGALVRLCVAAGAARVIVTDHPVNDADRCFQRSGILDATRQAGGRLVTPAQTRFHFVQIPGKLGRWPVLEPFITATKIINVPVAKHHSLTRATLGMKNWYGILGGRRNQLHQRIDDSVAELAALMRPTLTVMDATRLLLRNGPTGGSLADVKQHDMVAASIDPIAVDAWAVTQLEADPAVLNWLRLGQERKLGTTDFRSLGPLELTTG